MKFQTAPKRSVISVDGHKIGPPTRRQCIEVFSVSLAPTGRQIEANHYKQSDGDGEPTLDCLPPKARIFSMNSKESRVKMLRLRGKFSPQG
jgi:hypothetical protein